MEIKLAWMGDFGAAKAQGLLLRPPATSPPRLPQLFERESSPLVSDREEMPPVVRCQNAIWALSHYFHIKDTCEGCLSVDLQNTLLKPLFIVFFFSCSLFYSLFFFCSSPRNREKSWAPYENVSSCCVFVRKAFWKPIAFLPGKNVANSCLA